MKNYTKPLLHLLCLFISFTAFSQSSDQLQKDFVKGNLSEKNILVDSANNDGLAHSDLWIVGFDFINTNYDLLSEDSDFIMLARNLVQKSSVNDIDALMPSLKTLFSITQNPALVLDLLTLFSSISVENNEIVVLVNEYAESLLIQGNSVDVNMIYLTLEVLGNFADASSFEVLFQAYAYNENAEISQVALQSLSKLRGGYENQIRSLIERGTSREKYYTLELVLNNSQNSDFFRAEMSEKALSGTIINIGDVSAVDNYTVDLQMAAIRELVRISWTRSAELITEFYLVAKKEFEAGSLTEGQFSEIINAFTALSSGTAGEYLSKDLEEFNKRQEENKAYSEAVVLTVIQSLGLLGNKIAFDALLYTTYLEYPEDIILAARDALVALKW